MSTNAKKKTKVKSSKKGVIAAFTTIFVILLALFIVIAVGSSWFTIRNPKDYFNGWGMNKGPQDETDIGDKLATEGGVVDGNGNVLEADKVYAMPASLTFIEAASVKAQTKERTMTAKAGTETIKTVTIRATLKPEDADVQLVTWNLVDNSMNHVLAIEPSAEDPLVATLTCSGTVDQKSYIICSSVENPEIKATCSIDYLAPVTSAELVADGLDEVDGTTYDLSSSVNTGNIFWRSLTPGSGTVFGTAQVSIIIEMTYEFSSAVASYLGLSSGSSCSWDPEWNTQTTSFILPTSLYVFNDFDNVTENEFVKAYRQAAYANPEMQQLRLTVNVDYVYGARSYGSDYIDKTINIDVTNIGTPVTDIELNPGDIVIIPGA